jgi:thioredoxin reductase
MTGEITDITIIGGGPTGLYAAFYGGMRERSVRIIDSLPELGGQLMALYPEKDIFDIGGFPRVLAKDLARDLIVQASQFSPEIVLDEEIIGLAVKEDGILLTGKSREYSTRTLILAGGKGAFEPIKLKCPGFDEFMGRGVGYAVKELEAFGGKRILMVGGGDSALDWALALKDVVSELCLVHRRDGFRAHERTVAQIHHAADAGELDFRPFYEVREIRGGDSVESVVIFDNKSGDETTLEVDAILTFLGFKPDLGPMGEWGLELEGNRVVVDRLMGTNLPGVYGAGDLVSYEGKLDLIATGFAEAATAVNSAVQFVDPSARKTAGHSTSLKVFKNQ